MASQAFSPQHMTSEARDSKPKDASRAKEDFTTQEARADVLELKYGLHS